MPIIELICTQCGKVSEEIIHNVDGKYPDCPDCGGKREQKYDGKCYCNQSKSGGGCSGNCSCCGGCK